MASTTSTIPATCLAAVVKEFHKPYTLTKTPVPSPNTLSPHDILLKPGPSTPRPRTHFAIGDRIIAISIRDPCGTCTDCTGPEEHRLTCKFTRGFTGISLPGVFQEYMVVDARFSVRIPDAMGFVRAAPLTCAGSTSWRAVKRAGVRRGGWLGVVGSGGGLGHLAVQFAKKMGVNVVGVDGREVGLELSRRMGADLVVDVGVGAEALVRAVRGRVGEDGAEGERLCDAAVVLSDAPGAVHTAMMITRCHGLVVQVAQPDKVEFPFQEMIFRDIRLMGSNLSSRQELEDLVRFVEEEDVVVETTVFRGLQSLEQVLERAHSGTVAGKIMVVVVDPEQVDE
ncbi:NAD(P)-binding protein [Aspergillus ellipticus CBS 707.79]|uniref:NAD(P)-binding protein n=1 Tax=Aspergillus ellipticus CBS 707.79 TaxID=1448320 RepID=A0A319E4L4_9EURO|nr:NAD(P)-binding protein [Aspergillus ellipticus CBS 707.79]